MQKGLGQEVQEQEVVQGRKTAVRDIYTAIREWSGKRSIAEKHWIWELVQNAGDSGLTEEGTIQVKVKVSLQNDKLVFEHSGGPFSTEDLAALVLGGSSKPAFTPESRHGGRFGIGFLVTRILSKQVQVEGKARTASESIQDFEFTLDRSGTEDEILKNINIVYQALNRSAAAKPQARFSYSLSDVGAKDAAEQGLQSLGSLIPYVLALVPHLKSVNVATNGSVQVWERGEEGRQNVVNIIPIRVSELLSDRKGETEVAIIKLSDPRNEIHCMIEARPQGDGSYALVPPSWDVPRLFYPYPLVGKSSKIGLPVVLGGRFEPSKDRDDILLSGNSREVEANKDMIKRALPLIVSLAEYAANQGWANAHLLARLERLDEDSEVSGAEWWNEQFQEVIHSLKEKAIVAREDGQKCSPEQIGFPVPLLKYPGPEEDTGSEEVSLGKSWNLWTKLCYLPEKQVANDWQVIIRNWNRILGESEFEVFDVSGLTEKIREAGNVEVLAQKGEFETDTDAVFNWLRDFIELLAEYERNTDTAVPDDYLYHLLPNQEGVFKSPHELYRDKNIPSDLKGIAGNVGWNIAALLLEPHVLTDFLERKVQGEYDEDSVIQGLISKMNWAEGTRLTEASQIEACRDLLVWLALKRPEKSTLAIQLPVLAEDNYIQKASVKPLFILPPSL